MAQAKKKKTTVRRRKSTTTTKAINPATKKHTHRKRHVKRNPVVVVKRRRRSNPEGQLSKFAKKPIELLKAGALLAVGVLATRQLPQLALKDKNSGYLGYGANVLAAIFAGYLAHLGLGPEAAEKVFSGGGLYLFNRMLNDLTPLGRTLNLSGVGDVHAAGHLGALVPAYFPLPVVNDRQGNPVIPQQIIDAALRAMPAPAPAPSTGVSGIVRPGAMIPRQSSRFSNSRFASRNA